MPLVLAIRGSGALGSESILA